MNQTKKELEEIKAKYEAKIKSIENKIDKIKTPPIGFQYNNRKL